MMTAIRESYDYPDYGPTVAYSHHPGAPGAPAPQSGMPTGSPNSMLAMEQADLKYSAMGVGGSELST